jgi:hypothetical protein
MSSEDYNTWTVKELKDFLRMLAVDTTGVLEKSELVTLVQQAESRTSGTGAAAAAADAGSNVPGGEADAKASVNTGSAAGAGAGSGAGTNAGSGAGKSSWGYGGLSSYYREPSPPPPEVWSIFVSVLFEIVLESECCSL